MMANRRRTDPLSVAAFVISIIVGLVVAINGFPALIDTSGNAKDAARDAEKAADGARAAVIRLDVAVRGGCKRLQAERERSNVIEASLFQTLSAAAEATPDRRARRIYRNQAAAAAWSPPANCAQAVNEPGGYKPPRPVPFLDLPSNYAQRIIAAAKTGRPQPLP